ncbi:fructose 1,6-bisphosphate aldolase [Salmonella enterica subsp. enterica]|uniref:fructose-bisphosphate aldolase n=1 Tax=Salmonella enterica I TaxID=59201 RepID=A0A379UUN0_SALET|nr:fructose 1,6-bisphosphate aldolase [Salmonella enterica subsp. enterica]
MSKIGMTSGNRTGLHGGEEDGVDNSHMDASALYTQPEDVDYAYTELSKISPRFTIAASFGNVHGVYKPGNVVLTRPFCVILRTMFLRNITCRTTA